MTTTLESNLILNYLNALCGNLEKKLIEAEVDEGLLLELESKCDKIIRCLAETKNFRLAKQISNKTWSICKTLNKAKKVSDYESYFFVLRLKIFTAKIINLCIMISQLSFNDLLSCFEIQLDIEHSLLKLHQMSNSNVSSEIKTEELRKRLLSEATINFSAETFRRLYDQSSSKSFGVSINNEASIYNLVVDFVKVTISRCFVLCFQRAKHLNKEIDNEYYYGQESNESCDSIMKLLSLDKEDNALLNDKIIMDTFIVVNTVLKLTKDVKYNKEKSTADMFELIFAFALALIKNNFYLIENDCKMSSNSLDDIVEQSIMIKLLDSILNLNYTSSSSDSGIVRPLKLFLSKLLSNSHYAIAMKYSIKLNSAFKVDSPNELEMFLAHTKTLLAVGRDNIDINNLHAIFILILNQKKASIETIETLISLLLAESLDVSIIEKCFQTLLKVLGSLCKGGFLISSISFNCVNLEIYPIIPYYFAFFFFSNDFYYSAQGSSETLNLLEIMKSVSQALVSIMMACQDKKGKTEEVKEKALQLSISEEALLPTLVTNFIIYFSGNDSRGTAIKETNYSSYLLKEIVKSKKLISPNFVELYCDLCIRSGKLDKLKEFLVDIEEMESSGARIATSCRIDQFAFFSFYSILTCLKEDFQWDTQQRLKSYLNLMTKAQDFNLEYFLKIFHFYFNVLNKKELSMMSSILNHFASWITTFQESSFSALNTNNFSLIWFIQFLLSNLVACKDTSNPTSMLSMIKPFLTDISSLIEWIDFSTTLFPAFFCSNHLAYLYTMTLAILNLYSTSYVKQQGCSTMSNNDTVFIRSESAPVFVLDFCTKFFNCFSYNVQLVLNESNLEQTALFFNHCRIENANFLSTFKMLILTFIINKRGESPGATCLDLFLRYNSSYSHLCSQLINYKDFTPQVTQAIKNNSDSITTSTQTAELLLMLELRCCIMQQSKAQDDGFQDYLDGIVSAYSINKKLMCLVSGILYQHDLKEYCKSFLSKLLNSISSKQEVSRVYTIEDISALFKDYILMIKNLDTRLSTLLDFANFIFKSSKKVEAKLLDENIEYTLLTLLELKAEILK